ncbi:MAG TPA: class I SAM-dependent methyltransferase [Gemmatimonadales bacterium]|jgi:S-adenosylmethionine-dependent methyltransferase|nr:class I SAM-dependent methyltransferase [Gemmatimonadales bacterium]
MISKKRFRASVAPTIKRFLFPIPQHLSRKHQKIDPGGLQAIKASIQTRYHSGWRSESRYSRETYEHDLKQHLIGRLESDRRMIVPWLDQARPLSGSRILEIGCGTGSSTVALAEQGAEVVGIDIDHDALAVAQVRCTVYGMRADLHPMNATKMAETFQDESFDFIIFFASLEHMTIAERLAALSDAWRMLPLGMLLVIVETPNRLWYSDGHTSMLPFFHWLPNELAFKYAALSPRENFREIYTVYDAPSKEHFLRQGRGASFHEFDLAIKPAKELKVVSSLSTFHGFRHKPQRSLLDRRYKAMLRRIYPGIHPGFCDDTLFLIIEKD